MLERGFALVRDRAGSPVTLAADLKSGERLTLRFADGERSAIADGKAKRKVRTAADQGSLL